MKKLQEAISYRVLDAAMTDWDFKDLILSLDEQQVSEVLVLPSYLRRAKQLLMTSSIRLGCVIDYPLGNGTLGKTAFETGQMFREGADFLEIWRQPLFYLTENDEGKSFYDSLKALTVAGGEIRWAVATKEMKELTKIQIAQKLKERECRYITLGEDLTLEQAKHDLELFQLDGGDQLEVQLNLQSSVLQDLQEVLAQGAGKVGLLTLPDGELSLKN